MEQFLCAARELGYRRCDGHDGDQRFQCRFAGYIGSGDSDHFDSGRLQKLILAPIAFALQSAVVRSVVELDHRYGREIGGAHHEIGNELAKVIAD
jgi:hypothetical protein